MRKKLGWHHQLPHRVTPTVVTPLHLYVIPNMTCNVFGGAINLALSRVAQSCYSVIGDKPFMEQAKIRPSVTLYSLDWSLPNLVWLRRRPLLVCQFWLNLVGWGIPRKYVKYNLSVAFCSVFFSCTRLEQKPVNGFARSIKMREIRQGCAFWGFCQKIFYPTPNIPQIPKILHYVSSFSHKTRRNLGGSAAKIRIRIGNSP